MDDTMWNHAVFSKNRDRLLTSELAQRFFAEVNARAKKFLSDARAEEPAEQQVAIDLLDQLPNASH